jgi:hypothetical protein
MYFFTTRNVGIWSMKLIINCAYWTFGSVPAARGKKQQSILVHGGLHFVDLKVSIATVHTHTHTHTHTQGDKKVSVHLMITMQKVTSNSVYSVYCLCVNVSCTAATRCQPNCSYIYIYISIMLTAWQPTARARVTLNPHEPHLLSIFLTTLSW